MIGLVLGVVLSMTVLKTSGRPSMPNGENGGPQMRGNGTGSATGGSGMQKKDKRRTATSKLRQAQHQQVKQVRQRPKLQLVVMR